MTFFSGGSGLVSTIDDYAKFAQMMPNGGELNGVRLLGRKTVELMTQNSIGDDYILWHDDFGDKFGYRIAANKTTRREKIGRPMVNILT